jgi:hypothetical protein
MHISARENMARRKIELKNLGITVANPLPENRNDIVNKEDGWMQRWKSGVINKYGGTPCQDRLDFAKYRYDTPIYNSTRGPKMDSDTCSWGGLSKCHLSAKMELWHKIVTDSITNLYQGDHGNTIVMNPDINLKAIVRTFLVECYESSQAHGEHGKTDVVDVYEMVLLFLLFYHFPPSIKGYSKLQNRRYVPIAICQTIVNTFRDNYPKEKRPFHERLIELDRNIGMIIFQLDVEYTRGKETKSDKQHTHGQINSGGQERNRSGLLPLLVGFMMLIQPAAGMSGQSEPQPIQAHSFKVDGSLVNIAAHGMDQYRKPQGIVQWASEQVTRLIPRALHCNDFNRDKLPNIIESMRALVELRDKTIPSAAGQHQLDEAAKSMPALKKLGTIIESLTHTIAGKLDYLISETLKAITEGRTRAEVDWGLCRTLGPYHYVNQTTLDGYNSKLEEVMKRGNIHPDPVLPDYLESAKKLMGAVYEFSRGGAGTQTEDDVFDLIWSSVKNDEVAPDAISSYIQVRYLIPSLLKKLGTNEKGGIKLPAINDILKTVESKINDDSLLKSVARGPDKYITNAQTQFAKVVTEIQRSLDVEKMKEIYDAYITAKDNLRVAEKTAAEASKKAKQSNKEDLHKEINKLIIFGSAVSVIIPALLLYWKWSSKILARKMFSEVIAGLRGMVVGASVDLRQLAAQTALAKKVASRC